MYLILHASNGGRLENDNNIYFAIYTDDLHRVSKVLNDKVGRVFKLDGLTELKEVEVSFKEVTEEMKDE